MLSFSKGQKIPLEGQQFFGIWPNGCVCGSMSKSAKKPHETCLWNVGVFWGTLCTYNLRQGQYW
jgi:hypothetical protein